MSELEEWQGNAPASDEKSENGERRVWPEPGSLEGIPQGPTLTFHTSPPGHPRLCVYILKHFITDSSLFISLLCYS